MNCFACNKGTMELGTGAVAREFKGRCYSVEVKGEVCSCCGYTIIEGSEVPKLMRQLADLHREEEKLLTSAQIQSRRSDLRMTQQEFADYLRVGVASVKRWENGQVQEKAMDELIRIKTDAEYAGRIRDSLSSTVFSLDGIQLCYAISPQFYDLSKSMNLDLSGLECPNGSELMPLAA